VVGASIFSGIGALITNHPPYKSMLDVASSIKIWAIAAAMGGTFSSFTVIERVFLDNIEIQKVIKEKYNSLLGKKVKDLDADLLLQIIDQRILKMNDKEYRLNVNKLILSEILKIWVDIDIIE